MSLRFTDPVVDQTAGKRVFNVLAQGAVILPDLDVVAAAGGSLKALERTVPVHVTGGKLKLDFVSKTGEAILSSLSVAPQAVVGERAPYDD